jgi:hypothetical protein
MKNAIKGYQKAGLIGLVGLFGGLIALLVPLNGAEHVAAAALAFLGLVATYCWYLGRFGTERTKSWVEENF